MAVLDWSPNAEQRNLSVRRYFSSTVGDTIGDSAIQNTNSCTSIESCINGNATKGGGTWVSSLCNKAVSLTDSNETEGAGSYIDLASGKSGFGSIIVGDGVARCNFRFLTTGEVFLISSSDNVYTSVQTGTNHVIIKDNGSYVRIVNELGSTQTFTITIKYTN